MKHGTWLVPCLKTAIAQQVELQAMGVIGVNSGTKWGNNPFLPLSNMS